MYNQIVHIKGQIQKKGDADRNVDGFSRLIDGCHANERKSENVGTKPFPTHCKNHG